MEYLVILTQLYALMVDCNRFSMRDNLCGLPNRVNVPGWVTAGTREAMARAAAALDDTKQFEHDYTKAAELASSIPGNEDIEQIKSDLASEPWFGMGPVTPK